MAAIPGVITKQPRFEEMSMMTSISLTDTPVVPPGCPPGLEYLTMVDQLLVRQQIELLEVLFGCETNNRYRVLNTMGQEVYFAAEDTPFCTRWCCGPIRPFDIRITDNFHKEVLHLYRPCRCQGCCFPCCLQEMTIMSPQTGNILGFVKEEWSFLEPRYIIENASRDPVFKIRGPICHCRCFSDVVFKIYNMDGETVAGEIRKQWTGLLTEMFTDADLFNVTFSMDLDPSLKAVLLGALFLIDFMYFERSNNNNN